MRCFGLASKIFRWLIIDLKSPSVEDRRKVPESL